MRKLTIGLLTGGLFFGMNVSAQPKPEATPKHVSYTQIVNFKKGASDLSKADQETLSSLVQTIKDRSQKIEQVHVAAWSDQASANRELANQRANVIQDYFEGALAQSYVETYNMSERSNWFARATSANARDIKKMFAQKGAPQNVTPEDFAMVRSKGGPMKAVVLIEIEPSAMMTKD